MAGCALQVATAQVAGAAAVLVGNTQATGFMRMQPDPPTPGFELPNTAIPSASLPRNSATTLAAALAAKQVSPLLYAPHGPMNFYSSHGLCMGLVLNRNFKLQRFEPTQSAT